MLTEMVADQVAPSYWVPNKDTQVNRFPINSNEINLFYFFQRNVHYVDFNLVQITPNIIVEVCLSNTFFPFLYDTSMRATHLS
jgi:hypothetical protein